MTTKQPAYVKYLQGVIAPDVPYMIILGEGTAYRKFSSLLEIMDHIRTVKYEDIKIEPFRRDVLGRWYPMPTWMLANYPF